MRFVRREQVVLTLQSNLTSSIRPTGVFASNERETLHQRALDHEILVSLDTGYDLCCSFEGYSMPSGVEVWVAPTRLFGETEHAEAAHARIATIPGGSSSKVSEPHFTVCHRGLEEQFRILLTISHDISASLSWKRYLV